MLVLFAWLLLAFQTANAATRNITTDSFVSCHSSHNDVWIKLSETILEPNMSACDFPLIVDRNPLVHNYSFGYYSGLPATYSLAIDFNETLTTHPYIIEGQGIVISDEFNGYHAREVAYNDYNLTLQCNGNSSYTQTITGNSFLVVFDNDLVSEDTRKRIENDFTVREPNGDLNKYKASLLTQQMTWDFSRFVLNDTGLVCWGVFTTNITTVTTF